MYSKVSRFSREIYIPKEEPGMFCTFTKSKIKIAEMVSNRTKRLIYVLKFEGCEAIFFPP